MARCLLRRLLERRQIEAANMEHTTQRKKPFPRKRLKHNSRMLHAPAPPRAYVCTGASSILAENLTANASSVPILPTSDVVEHDGPQRIREIEIQPTFTYIHTN